MSPSVTMLVRPSLGQLRAVARSAPGRHRPPLHTTPRRPLHLSARPSCTTPTSKSVRVMRLVAAKRGFGTAARVTMRSYSLSHSLKSWARKVTASLRSTLTQTNFVRLHRFLSNSVPVHAFKRRVSSSEFARGALSAFRASASGGSSAAGRSSAYSRLGRPFVTFARGATSGLGARPAFGSLALSPTRGGLGLQTARNFSSGGARIFDNLVVNAPLALRLASDEVEQKSKLLARPHARRPRSRAIPADARVAAKDASSTLLLNKVIRTAAPASVATTEAILDNDHDISVPSRFAQKQKAIETDLNTYFELPSLCLPSSLESTVVLTIRLVDPLYEALGGRDPLPFDVSRGGYGATLFDAPFSLDLSTVLANEHRRYMQAKAVLRVLYDHGLLSNRADSMDLFSHPEQWSISVSGVTASAVRHILDAEVAFEYRPWISFDSEDDDELRSSAGNHSGVASTNSSSFHLDQSPPSTTASSLDTDEYVAHGFAWPVVRGSLLHTPPSSPSESSLFDSREFA